MIACMADRAPEFLGMITKEFLLKFKEGIRLRFGDSGIDVDDEETGSVLEYRTAW